MKPIPELCGVCGYRSGEDCLAFRVAGEGPVYRATTLDHVMPLVYAQWCPLACGLSEHLAAMDELPEAIAAELSALAEANPCHPDLGPSWPEPGVAYLLTWRDDARLNGVWRWDGARWRRAVEGGAVAGRVLGRMAVL